MENLNQEKMEILSHEGNTLVIANPGTGKTFLLAYKYTELIKKGVKPEDILCLTFTNKAKQEMEERVLKVLKEYNFDLDLSKLNIYTFHSYALETLSREDTISSNLLRYSIYRYFIDNQILNYSEDYMLSTIVPKMENLIRYLKSFGISPNDINLKEVKNYLSDFKSFSKEEIDKFAEYFVEVYEYYESEKNGIDYGDMLLEFMKIKNKPKFKYVLVDELQDVNALEADIALESGEIFFGVGDKKQAIFGFQGGSIINFQKFSSAKTFILSENFRSTDQILSYAREYFSSKTKDSSHKSDLEKLHSENNRSGPKPVLYTFEGDDTLGAVYTVVKRIKSPNTETAVIARTNYQVMNISKTLQKMGIEHSSSYFSSSNTARDYILKFIKGVFSNNVDDIFNSMFTPFFPISLQDAFEISTSKNLEKLYHKSPEFKAIRENTKNVQDVDILFNNTILPISAAYGKEYLIAAINLKEAFNEAVKYIDNKNLNNIIGYLKSADLLGDISTGKKQVIVTTIHKSKGRQFDKVVYFPHSPRNNENFQDSIVQAILKSKKINAEEELEEEPLRMDFVALTRAKNELYIIPNKLEQYINDCCDVKDLEIEDIDDMELSEKLKKAYALFVNGSIEKSQELLNNKKPWIREYVRNHFESLDHLSYTALNIKPEDYLKRNILRIREFSTAANTGSLVHNYTDQILKGISCEPPDELIPFIENSNTLIQQIKEEYPDLVCSEKSIKINLKHIMETDQDLLFSGKIDAIFKNNDEYLIVDWKTDKSSSYASEHRRQLEVYRHIYSLTNEVSLDNIKVALGFVGLRPKINTGEIGYELDKNQPQKNVFQTFIKHVNIILSWRKNPDLFFESLKNVEDPLISALIEQYELEK